MRQKCLDNFLSSQMNGRKISEGSNSGLHVNSVPEPSNDSETDPTIDVHFTAWFLALIFV